MQSLEEQSTASSKLQKQIDATIGKEKQNVKKLYALKQIQADAVALAEAQQQHIERTVTSATTSMAETSESEADMYCGGRPKDTNRAPPAPMKQVASQVQQSAISVGTSAQQKEMLSQSSNIDAALLHKVFNTVLGMMNVCCDATPQARKVEENEDDEVFDSLRLPIVPDTPVTGSGVSHVRFGKAPVRRDSLSSTSCPSPSPVSSVSEIPAH